MDNDDDCDDNDSEFTLGNEYFRDADNDGFGDPVVSLRACDIQEGYVDN